MIPDDIKQKIDSGDFTFIDKVIYGGFGYGKVCIPDELPQIILAVIFPPLSIIWNWYVGLYSIWKTISKFHTSFKYKLDNMFIIYNFIRL